MHRQSFIFIVTLSVLACIFLMIYKQATITKLLYEQQELEKEHAQAIALNQQLTKEYYHLKNPALVQDYAKKTLGMQKSTLSHVRKIPKE